MLARLSVRNRPESAGCRHIAAPQALLGLLRARNPNPKWVAPPGTSLHRWATELDLGPPAAYDWLWRNHRRFGFIRRYAWEPWHYELPLAANRGIVERIAPAAAFCPVGLSGGRCAALCSMERLGVRELHQNLSVPLRRVQRGESLEVTEYDLPVAVLAPLPEPAGTRDGLSPPRARARAWQHRRARAAAFPLNPTVSVSDALADERADRI